MTPMSTLNQIPSRYSVHAHWDSIFARQSARGICNKALY
ncbi:hypothetical protein CSC02_1274 [Enterobacter hormaechei subsp. hoffmannii]|nr:hypothetical protein CSC02_1274 [Enterobacter hormaechei subsp. hoffmannii]